MFADVGSGLSAAVAILLMLLLSSGVFQLLQNIRREHCHEVEVVTLGNHPNLVRTFSDPVLKVKCVVNILPINMLLKQVLLRTEEFHIYKKKKNLSKLPRGLWLA